MTEKKNIRRPVKNGIAKTPVIMQMEALECGAACLAMIMAYYEKWIPLEQVREDCGVSRDGSKAGNITKAARMYGFEAKGYRLEPEELKKVISFPCIIHWEFNHFVVLNGFKKGKVYINDPARGNVILTEEEFDDSFTGVCISIMPGVNFNPSGKKKSMTDFAKKRMEGTGSAVAFTAITTCIISLCSMAVAGFARFFVDVLLGGNNPGLLAPFILGLSFISIVQIIALWIQAVYTLRISGKFSAVGNTTYFWHVLRLPMGFFSQRMAGDIEQRRMTNAGIADVLVNIFAPLFVNAGMLVFYLFVMIRYSPALTLVGILCIIINISVAGFISEKRVNVTRVLMRDEAKLASTTVSGIEMIETIKSSGAENGFFRKWSGYQASVNAQRARYVKIDQYLGNIPVIVMSLTNIVILILGVYFVIKGEFSAGMVIAFQGFMSQFLMPAQSFVDAGQSLQEMRTEMERIEDVMEYPTDDIFSDKEKGEDSDDTIKKLSGKLEIRDLSFGYSKLSDPLIEGFNLDLEPGKSVALVGRTGCGKSTLSKLISGVYKPWSGEILFDGKHISDIDKDVFRGSVAVVNQDITLFEDTISNNIKMWDNSIEDFEMILAARDAQIHEDIMQRDGGYRYKLNEGGSDFSGGQRQRLEIARVLSQDPTLIIMDEATSSLDAQTEYDVVSSIKQRGITCVVIAHRLSTIRECDEIIVLDKGRVVERGTHKELMELGGEYTKLVVSE